MTNKQLLKKQIIYRSTHRGTKEMDILLGNFAKKYIDVFSEIDLQNLNNMLFLEDEILHEFYFKDNKNLPFDNNKVFSLFKKFKL